MNERIVIIGSNSFSGASFVAYCLSEGMDILGISRSEEPVDAFLPYKWDSEKKGAGSFRFEQLDINRHIGEIIRSIRAFEPPYIVNFAAQSMVAESWEQPEHWYQTNVVANVKLHDALRHFDFLKKYVHVSTPEVYGNCTGEVTESTTFNPSTPYAASRAACELHLRTFFNYYRFPVTYTRAANVYGPGQRLYRIIPRTIMCIKFGRKLHLHGGGASVRSFIHARDVADATLRVALVGVPGEAYHIATDSYISIRELVRMICRMMGADFDSVAEVVDERPGKDMAYLLDSSKIRNDMRWSDRIGLEEGIRETIRWISDNFEQLRQQPFEYIHKE